MLKISAYILILITISAQIVFACNPLSGIESWRPEMWAVVPSPVPLKQVTISGNRTIESIQPQLQTLSIALSNVFYRLYGDTTDRTETCTITFTIATNGDVIHASLSQTSVNDNAFRRAVIQTVKGQHFSDLKKGRGGTTTVEYPVSLFSPIYSADLKKQKSAPKPKPPVAPEILVLSGMRSLTDIQKVIRQNRDALYKYACDKVNQSTSNATYGAFRVGIEINSDGTVTRCYEINRRSEIVDGFKEDIQSRIQQWNFGPAGKSDSTITVVSWEFNFTQTTFWKSNHQ